MAKRIITPWAENGDKDSIPETPVGLLANWQNGYPSSYEEDPGTPESPNPNARFVERDVTNQIYNDITSNIQEWQNRVYPEFVIPTNNGGTPVSYDINARVYFEDVLYRSLKNNNTDLIGEAGWIEDSNSASLVANDEGGSVQDFINSKKTTLGVVATGVFSVGSRVVLTDRAQAEFEVVSGGVANGLDIIDAGNGNTATLVYTSAITSARAFGAKLDWNGTTGTDDTLALQRIHTLGVTYSLDGLFALVSGTLSFSDGQRIYSFGGGIHKINAGYIFSSGGLEVEDIIVNGGFYTGAGLASFADCEGSGSGFNNSARSISFEDCRTAGIDVAFNWDNARACRVTRGRYACKTGIIYTNKSAECAIDSSLFIKDEAFPTVGTTGLKSFNGVDGFPEGLSIHKTLFYRFERNLNISGLFVADFVGCFFDSGGDDVKKSIISYETKTEGLKFTSCWFFSRGVQWGDGAASAPSQFRSQMIGCHFSFMASGVDVTFERFAHGITVTGSIHDSDDTGTHIGYSAINQNNGIVLSNLTFQNYDSYVQFKGVGAHNSVSNIPNRDELTDPVFYEYSVNTFNVEGYCIQVEDDIAVGDYLSGEDIASIDNIKLSSGIAWVVVDITGLIAPSTGYIKVFAYTAGTTDNDPNITLLTNVSLIAYKPEDTSVKVTLPLKVKKATTTKIVIQNESNSSSPITAGAFADSLTVVQ